MSLSENDDDAVTARYRDAACAQGVFAILFRLPFEDAKAYGPDGVFATPAGTILVQPAGSDERLWLEAFQAFRPDILVLAHSYEGGRRIWFSGWERSSALDLKPISAHPLSGVGQSLGVEDLKPIKELATLLGVKELIDGL